MKGKILFSPKAMNDAFRRLLQKKAWSESRVSYWVTKNEKLIRKTLTVPAEEQKRQIQAAGETPIFSYNQTDFVKDRVAVEIQFAKYSFVAYDLFVKHLTFYVGDLIDVGGRDLPPFYAPPAMRGSRFHSSPTFERRGGCWRVAGQPSPPLALGMVRLAAKPAGVK